MHMRCHIHTHTHDTGQKYKQIHTYTYIHTYIHLIVWVALLVLYSYPLYSLVAVVGHVYAMALVMVKEMKLGLCLAFSLRMYK